MQQTLWNVLAGGVVKNHNSLDAVVVDLRVRGKSRLDSETQFQKKKIEELRPYYPVFHSGTRKAETGRHP